MTWGMVAVAAATVIGAGANAYSTNKASKAATSAADKASGQIKDATGMARDDLFRLFPAAQANTMQGYQGALDVFKQSVPQQMAFGQAGNIAAQEQLISGMPQYQNAILGGPVDYSQFQATDLGQPNLDFMNQQISYMDPYGPADPLAGMTPDQIQAATATQPPAPVGAGAGNISITDQMNGITQPAPASIVGPGLGGQWAANNYNVPQLGGMKSGPRRVDFSRDLWRSK